MKRFLSLGLFGLMFILTQSASAAVADQKQPEPVNPFLQVIELSEETLQKNAAISFNVHLPAHHEFSPEAAFRYSVLRDGKILKEGILDPKKELPFLVRLDQHMIQSTIEINLQIPYCATEAPKLCKFKWIRFIQPVLVASHGKMLLELEGRV